MPFLWIPIDDPSGPQSLRKVVERNAIALLSNFEREAIDPPSASWLGLRSRKRKVRESGLWNIDHVDETFSPEFLSVIRDRIADIPASSRRHSSPN